MQNFGFPACPSRPVQRFKRTGQRLHIHHPHQVDHRHLIAAAVDHADPPAGCRVRIIRRPQKILPLLQQFINFPAAVGVVACGYDIGAALQDMLQRYRRNAIAVGGVFPVDHADIHTIMPFHPRQHLPQMPAAGAANHVPDAQNPHIAYILSVDRQPEPA